MKLQKSFDQIIRFEHKNFYVDVIITLSGLVEVWISEQSCGISEMMFGFENNFSNPLDLMEFLESNLEEYEADYEEKYC